MEMSFGSFSSLSIQLTNLFDQALEGRNKKVELLRRKGYINNVY